MTREEALEELATILQEEKESKDYEMSHVDADGVLCQLLTSLGYKDVVTEYHRVGKWYA
jgi:hypothetical protein